VRSLGGFFLASNAPPQAPPPPTVCRSDALPFGPGDWTEAFNWLDAEGGRRGAMAEAARALKCAYNTLASRYELRRAGVGRTGPQPRLGSDVEEALVDWIRLSHATGCSVPVPLLSCKAKEIAARLHLDPKLVGGEKWRSLFFARHDEIRVRQGQLIGIERLVSLSRPAIKRFYDILEASSEGVAPGDKWIADETNVELRDGAGKVSPLDGGGGGL